ncbi:phosphatase PAP2 family protein [Streptomyces sp. NPDC000983]|uniref:phosphatase PAP2 family protein n=1 Tax=Streptomyces sp. NPDC000983 TaxID=3154373 RepID=UPI0033238323
MGLWSKVHAEDHRLARRAIAWGPPWVRSAAAVVEETAEHTKLWCAVAGAMAAWGGWRGRVAASAGVAAMALAQLMSNTVAKQVAQRRRPPPEWVPRENLEERPASSSFPSGHTAAACAFVGAVTPVWPAAGVGCAVPAVLVAAQRVHSGAHYPSDVVGGCVIGLAAAALVRGAPRVLRRRLM